MVLDKEAYSINEVLTFPVFKPFECTGMNKVQNYLEKCFYSENYQIALEGAGFYATVTILRSCKNESYKHINGESET